MMALESNESAPLVKTQRDLWTDNKAQMKEEKKDLTSSANRP